MTQSHMSLAERIRKISGLAVLADASKHLADRAHNFELCQAHRSAQRDATAQLFALILTPEGQAALKDLEQLAVIVTDLDFNAGMPELVFIGADIATGPDVTRSTLMPLASGPFLNGQQVGPLEDIGGVR